MLEHALANAQMTLAPESADALAARHRLPLTLRGSRTVNYGQSLPLRQGSLSASATSRACSPSIGEEVECLMISQLAAFPGLCGAARRVPPPDFLPVVGSPERACTTHWRRTGRARSRPRARRRIDCIVVR